MTPAQRENIKAWIVAMRSGKYTHTKGPAEHPRMAVAKEGCALQVAADAFKVDLASNVMALLLSRDGLFGGASLDVFVGEINDHSDSYEPVCLALEKYLEEHS